MQSVFDIYNQFLSFFPAGAQWVVSLVLAALLVFAVYKILKRNFIFLILLVVILPASLPILVNLWENLLVFLKFLLTKR